MEVNVFGIASVVIVNIPLFTTDLEVNDFDIASFEIWSKAFWISLVCIGLGLSAFLLFDAGLPCWVSISLTPPERFSIN